AGASHGAGSVARGPPARNVGGRTRGPSHFPDTRHTRGAEVVARRRAPTREHFIPSILAGIATCWSRRCILKARAFVPLRVSRRALPPGDGQSPRPAFLHTEIHETTRGTDGSRR